MAKMLFLGAVQKSASMAFVILVLSFTASIVTADEHQYDCVGEILFPGEVLRRGEYIGPTWACSDGDYRFGLNEEGELGSWNTYDGVAWLAGASGDYLQMQRDGNLVLYKSDGSVAWATDCFGDNVELRRTDDDPIATAYDGNGDIVWLLNEFGYESPCYPSETEEFPTTTCIGSNSDDMGQYNRLFPTEYLCDGAREDDQVRFGLNAHGRLIFWKEGRIVWTPPQEESIGDFLSLQPSDGNLVLYQYAPNQPLSSDALWSTDCFPEDPLLKVENGEVELIDRQTGDTIWMIDSQGNAHGGCRRPDETDPPRDCTSVSDTGSNSCVVQMLDFVNMDIVNIKVEKQPDLKFKTTLNFDSKTCRGTAASWSATADMDDPTWFDPSYRDISCADLLTEPQFQMRDSDEREFRTAKEYNMPCNGFAQNLIYFYLTRLYSEEPDGWIEE